MPSSRLISSCRGKGYLPRRLVKGISQTIIRFEKQGHNVPLKMWLWSRVCLGFPFHSGLRSLDAHLTTFRRLSRDSTDRIALAPHRSLNCEHLRIRRSVLNTNASFLT